ncbi:MAG TPA: 3-deoxy-7-phosphoheptulonate synthase [Candidatus Acidoferrum sp.]|nr:3-deoxy-7-phosphoheptulonate synthase [Candidatus Acidoferrum sp.]
MSNTASRRVASGPAGAKKSELSVVPNCAILFNMYRTQDLHVKEIVPLLSPRALKGQLPTTDESNATVARSRERVIRILRQEDPRQLVVIGPCSIHDEKSALEYATRLNALRKQLADRMEIVMRVYFEKPRTTIGWKGLINDPHLDGSQDIGTGLKIARRLLLEITGMGLPAATEFLDPVVPQYTADLITWAAIGARTTESQTHREMASGLSMPVGLKNSTDGSLQVAIDAMGATRHPHSFLGINEDGVTSIVRTSGNPHAHVVLRGGRAMTNYDAASILAAEQKLASEKLSPILMVDCSHANSSKQFAKQEDVWHSVIEQRIGGTGSLIGLMVESHLHEGNQPIPQNLAQLKYGVSITDSCIGWETTERMLTWGYETLGKIISASKTVSA